MICVVLPLLPPIFLSSIIEFDKVLVMGDGKVLEYGSPKELLKLEDGSFFSMVQETGEKTSKRLIQKANDKK